ncbi:MAG: glycoside hydrolase family 16 protein [Acidobacteria bacterium]|nr:glycoside hydrolase family 16 protein [Acidobacteriota bacterium]
MGKHKTTNGQRSYLSTFVYLMAGCLACGGSASPSAPTPPQALAAAGSAVLLRDDFNGPALDTSLWFVPTGEGSFLGRTQIRPPTQALQVAGGVLRLQLDTFNPTARVPGDSFWGSEIASRMLFDRGAGLAFRARVRLVRPVPPGLVASLFSYATRGGVRDEIDFEMLTNDVDAGAPRILTNLFTNDPFSVPGRRQFVTLPASGPTEFTELEVQWMTGAVRWLVNGSVSREQTMGVPTEPMSVRLNFWAPDQNFADAFSAMLQPAASVTGNRTFFYEIDWVEIRRLGTPP